MDNDTDIAIVGMACRFPGARDVREFWQNLAAGVESISQFTDEELLAAGIPRETLDRADYVKAAPVLEDADKFDAAFFSYPGAEAEAIDPQQRVLLELTHLALEDAACDPARLDRRIGLFAGSALNTYFLRSGLSDRLTEDYIPTLVGADKDFLATRISYKLGLRGPSLTVQTACSTSLVAIHLARQSLLNEETDVSIAGAVSIRVPLRGGYFYDGSGVVSPDGHVRAFDAAANGTVFGSGAGVIVLKRLADALANNDHIHAVIKGSAVNNDGSEKAGFTAPSVDGQADAVIEALANAGVDAADISYVETHGSGTPVGDRIELLALTKAFRRFSNRKSYCAIGSVKSNIGHLDAAAGMAGVIKTALALQHQRIPGTLHFQRSSDDANIEQTPFFVAKTAREWPRTNTPRRAGVMSTGMGGTNAHLVLEEAPLICGSVDGPAVGQSDGLTGEAGPELLVLSAKTPGALESASARLADFLSSSESIDLGSVARTLGSGRRGFSHRRFVVARDQKDAAALLRSPDPARSGAGLAASTAERPVAFLFPGVGDQYAGMAHGLYDRYPAFRAELDHCAEIAIGHLGFDFRAVLFNPAAPAQSAQRGPAIDLRRMIARGEQLTAVKSANSIDATIRAQPILFSVEYALARLWMSWGIKPTHLVGHSLGEYVAATLSGVFALPDAIRLIAARAKLVSALPEAAMLAVMLPEQEIIPLLDDQLSISLVNGPQLCVVAGPVEALSAFRRKLDARGTLFRAVRNAHAFHSRMLQPITAEFAREVSQVPLNAPQIPFISNVTGTWIESGQARDPSYWADHAWRTARFSSAVDQLWKLQNCALVEAGPGRTLGVLAMQHPARPAGRPLSVSSLRSEYENQSDPEHILKAAGQLWAGGFDLDWDRITPSIKHPVISLPGYPFEKARHWMEAPKPGAGTVAKRVSVSSQPRKEIQDWFYVPSWQRSLPSTNSSSPAKAAWLILGCEPALSDRIVGRLRSRQEPVLTNLRECPAGPLNIVYFVGTGHQRARTAFQELVELARGLEEASQPTRIRLCVVASEVHDVSGDEVMDPLRRLVLGPAMVIGKENPKACCFVVDLPRLTDDPADLDSLANRLLDEFTDPRAESVNAFRGPHRWEQVYRPLALPATPGDAYRHRGVYLITGGTGGVGLAIGKFLAKACQAHLVLTKKAAFSPNTAWRQQLQADIEALGGTVDVFACDVTDERALRSLIETVESTHGAINGVIHAAGVLDDRLISTATQEVTDAVLSPKVDGTQILYDLVCRAAACGVPSTARRERRPYVPTQKSGPDFFVLFSSIASVAPFPGQCDYCAANSFLDGFAQRAAAEGPIPVTAINWPVWRDVGMMTRLKTDRAHREVLLRRSISTDEGIEAFKRALASQLPRLIVSPVDLDVIVAEAAQSRFANETPSEAVAPAGEEAETDPGKVVEQAWIRLLGIPGPIDRNASFFDLGGHSLLAMQVVSHLRARYRVNLTLRKFFEAPTIAATIAAIQARGAFKVESRRDDGAETLAAATPQ